MSHALQVAIQTTRDAIRALPPTDEPLQRMIERDIERGKYDAALPIREKLLRVADFLDPFCAIDQSARFQEMPGPVVASIVNALTEVTNIANCMPVMCQRQTTNTVPPSYNGSEPLVARQVENLHAQIYSSLMTFTPASIARPVTEPRIAANDSAEATDGAQNYDVALSFAGEDREYVEDVAQILKTAGIKVFYDKFETVELWGRNLADHLGEVYGKRSQFVVIFISTHYPLKGWPKHERQSAQARAIRDNKIVLLPARFDDTEIEGLPSSTAYIDLRKTSPQELAELIQRKLRK